MNSAQKCEQIFSELIVSRISGEREVRSKNGKKDKDQIKDISEIFKGFNENAMIRLVLYKSR